MEFDIDYLNNLNNCIECGAFSPSSVFCDACTPEWYKKQKEEERRQQEQQEYERQLKESFEKYKRKREPEWERERYKQSVCSHSRTGTVVINSYFVDRCEECGKQWWPWHKEKEREQKQKEKRQKQSWCSHSRTETAKGYTRSRGLYNPGYVKCLDCGVLVVRLKTVFYPRSETHSCLAYEIAE